MRCVYGCAIVIVCGVGSSARAQGQFIALGDLPGSWFESGSSLVSGNGVVVAGKSKVYDGLVGYQAFRWSAESGMEDLGNLPAPYFESDSRGISFYGNYVVGGSSSDNGREAFLWSEATGMVGLGDLPGRSFLSNASGVSADGRVVVGSSDSAENFDGGKQAFRWTNEDGMVGLGFLDGGRVNASAARDISADGLVIVGESTSSTGTQGFRWTTQTGMVPLASLPGSLEGFNQASIADVSSNGQYITGEDLNGDLLREGVLWTPEGEAIGLGFLDYGGSLLASRGIGVSNNGDVVGGVARSNGRSYGFLWTPETGMVDVENVLRDAGLDVAEKGWTLRSVTGVSADGHWITGSGTNPDGFGEAWLAYLPSIPAPTTLTPLAGLGLLGLRRRR